MDSVFAWFSFLLILGFALIIPLANVKSHLARKFILTACLASFNLGAVSLVLAIVSANRLLRLDLAYQSSLAGGAGSLGGAGFTALLFAAIVIGQNLFILVINRRSQKRIDAAG